ncbi:MAG: carboxypeptidase regulatory-like domain-containing protein [Acidobacteria bacterium]|jgi:hypothetical protein|nr:carboxypeptidase regulatory-like domain-containing protein [Acidobacteriota bacterium]
MKYFSKIIFLLLLSAFCSALVSAQDSGGVKGKVRTTKGEGIAAATITAKQQDEEIKSTTSDAKGNFVLENLKNGTYNLVFTKNGYSSGVLYNVEVKKKKVSDLGERLVLTIDQGTQVIIKGSVFAADGRSVGGAEIKIERVSSDGSIKKLGSSLSSYSGEFTFKLSQGAAKYRVTASAKGASASKEIDVDSAAIYRLAITLDSNK